MSTTAHPRKNANGDRPTIVIGLPSGWGRAGAAGLLAAFLGWAIPVAVALASFWTVADSPWLRQLAWQNAASAGSSFWALSLGSPAVLGQVSLSLLPGLWTLTQLAALRLFLAKMRHFSPLSVWTAVPTFSGLATLLAVATAQEIVWWRVAIGSAVISGIASLWVFSKVVPLNNKWAARLTPISAGIALGLLYLLLLNLVGLVGLFVAGVRQREAIGAATQALQGPGGGAAMLTVLQLMFLPLGAAWAASWMAGSGFLGVGGQLVTPTSPPEVGLPLPAWTTIPTTPTASFWWLYLVLGILVGAVSWLVLRGRSLWKVSTVLGIGALAGIAFTATWMGLSNGSLGSGSLAHLGPPTLAAATRLGLLFILPACFVPLGLHPEMIAAVRQGIPAREPVAAGRTDDSVEESMEDGSREFPPKDTLEAGVLEASGEGEEIPIPPRDDESAEKKEAGND